MSANDGGPLLIPKCELSRELRVLIDPGFDLERSINQTRFREIVDEELPIVLSIAATGQPANHVVAICWSERKDEDKLVLLLLTRQLHEHVIRIDRRGLFL